LSWFNVQRAIQPQELVEFYKVQDNLRPRLIRSRLDTRGLAAVKVETWELSGNYHDKTGALPRPMIRHCLNSDQTTPVPAEGQTGNHDKITTNHADNKTSPQRIPASRRFSMDAFHFNLHSMCSCSKNSILLLARMLKGG